MQNGVVQLAKVSDSTCAPSYLWRKQGFGKALSTLLLGLFGLRGIEKCFKNKVGKEDRLWDNSMIILGC